MQSLVWDKFSAISEFIYDTSIHKGQRGVTTVRQDDSPIAGRTVVQTVARKFMQVMNTLVKRFAQLEICDVHFILSMSREKLVG